MQTSQRYNCCSASRCRCDAPQSDSHPFSCRILVVLSYSISAAQLRTDRSKYGVAGRLCTEKKCALLPDASSARFGGAVFQSFTLTWAVKRHNGVMLGEAEEQEAGGHRAREGGPREGRGTDRPVPWTQHISERYAYFSSREKDTGGLTTARMISVNSQEVNESSEPWSAQRSKLPPLQVKFEPL